MKQTEKRKGDKERWRKVKVKHSEDRKRDKEG